MNDNPFGEGKTENSLNVLMRGLGNVGGKGEGADTQRFILPLNT